MASPSLCRSRDQLSLNAISLADNLKCFNTESFGFYVHIFYSTMTSQNSTAA